MELTLEQLKTEFKTHQDAIENRVKEIITSDSEEGKATVKVLQEQLKNLNEHVDKMEDEYKKSKAAGMPGLKEELNKKEFSWTAYVKGLYLSHPKINSSDAWKDGGYEKEIVSEYAKTRANTADDGSGGGFLIPPEVSNEIIDLAIAATPVLQMGVNMVRGLRGELPVPTLSGRPTTYWVGENEAPTASQATYGIKYLRPKKLAAFTKQSNRLIHQSRGVSDQVIRRVLAEAMALGLHDGLVNGTGSEKKPLGIMNQTGFTTSSVGTSGVLATNGARFKIDNASQMQKDLDVANELSMPGNFGYLMRPEVKSGMKRQTVLQYSGQAAADGAALMAMNPLMSDRMIEDILGYMFRTSTQLSATETTGTSSTTSSVLFGNWAMFWVAMWRDFELKVSDQASDGSTGSAFLDDQLYLVAFQEVDCNLMRGSAFTKVTGAETTESLW